MANIDLTQYGITGTTEIVHNPSYESFTILPMRCYSRKRQTRIWKGMTKVR